MNENMAADYGQTTARTLSTEMTQHDPVCEQCETAHYRRGDVVVAETVYPDCGSVQRGRRPAVIIQNNTGNLHAPTVIIAPITTGYKLRRQPTHTRLNRCEFLDSRSLVLAEQIMTIDKSYISKKLGHLDGFSMLQINDAIRISLGV